MSKIITIPKVLWTVQCVRKGELIWEDKGYNIVPYEGLNYILNVSLKGAVQSSSWYCSLFKNNITPSIDDTAVSALGSSGSYGEVTDADVSPSTNRPLITWGTVSNGSVDNSSNRIAFTIIPNSLTIYGAFITNTQAKLSTSGILLGARLFSAPRVLLKDDVLYVVVQFSVVSS